MESKPVNEETVKTLSELRDIVNNFRIRGAGVTGDLVKGYAVRIPFPGPTDIPPQPESPEQPESPPG